MSSQNVMTQRPSNRDSVNQIQSVERKSKVTGSTGAVGNANQMSSHQNQTQRLDSRSIERKLPKQKMQLDSSNMVNQTNDQIDHESQGTENTPSKQSYVSQSYRNKRYSSGQQNRNMNAQEDGSVGVLTSNNLSANSSQKQSINAAQSHRIGQLNKRNNMIISSNYEAQ